MAPTFTSGRTLILLANLCYSVGAFVADWSVTHVLNPRWPPHAKFHNGQTMTLGALLALASTYFAFRPAFSSTAGPSAAAQERSSILDAALVGSFYCAAGLTAILYPGTKWTDPEFGEAAPQKWLFLGIVIVVWIGYALEMRRLGSAKGRGKAA